MHCAARRTPWHGAHRDLNEDVAGVRHCRRVAGHLRQHPAGICDSADAIEAHTPDNEPKRDYNLVEERGPDFRPRSDWVDHHVEGETGRGPMELPQEGKHVPVLVHIVVAIAHKCDNKGHREEAVEEVGGGRERLGREPSIFGYRYASPVDLIANPYPVEHHIGANDNRCQEAGNKCIVSRTLVLLESHATEAIADQLSLPRQGKGVGNACRIIRAGCVRHRELLLLGDLKRLQLPQREVLKCQVPDCDLKNAESHGHQMFPFRLVILFMPRLAGDTSATAI